MSLKSSFRATVRRAHAVPASSRSEPARGRAGKARRLPYSIRRGRQRLYFRSESEVKRRVDSL